MNLDPLMKDFLDQLKASARPKVWDVSPDEMRVAFRTMVKGFGPKDVPIGKVENVTMPGPGGDLALRLFTPVAAGGDPLPALIYFHGGAFRVGDLDSHEAICRLLAGEIGCRVVAVDYRLSPEHKFPAAVDDALAATRWIETNATKLGIDPNRVAIGGDSAGGNLAAVVCHLAKAAQNTPHIACQLLLFPVTQFGSPFDSMRVFAEGYMLERATIEYCYEAYAPKELWSDPRLSPLLARDFAGLPPAYIMVAEADPLHDEGIAYAAKLREAGVRTFVADYPGLVHDFIMFQSVLPQAREALVLASKAVRGVFESA